MRKITFLLCCLPTVSAFQPMYSKPRLPRARPTRRADGSQVVTEVGSLRFKDPLTVTSVIAGFALLWKRVDDKVSEVEKKVEEKVGEVEKKVEEKVGEVEKKVGEVEKKVAAVEKNLGDQLGQITLEQEKRFGEIKLDQERNYNSLKLDQEKNYNSLRELIYSTRFGVGPAQAPISPVPPPAPPVPSSSAPPPNLEPLLTKIIATLERSVNGTAVGA